jgi:hypothetical protein
MKRVYSSLAVFWLMLGSAFAQVSAEVVLEQDQFLLGEEIQVAVRITNLSGQALRFGASEDWLTFSMESQEGSVVPKLGDVPVAGEFTLPTSKTATKRVNLGPYFPLTSQGRYGLVATVKIKDWDREITSKPAMFNVFEGPRLWEQAFGVPRKDTQAAGEPEIRKYVLQQANYAKGQLRLYLKLTDATGGRIYRVIQVGKLLTWSHPVAQLDAASNLHLLYQAGPRFYSYSEYNPEGELLARRTYDIANTRPKLKVDEDGKITVDGGTRRAQPDDLPPEPAKEESSKETAPPASTPASTNTATHPVPEK